MLCPQNVFRVRGCDNATFAGNPAFRPTGQSRHPSESEEVHLKTQARCKPQTVEWKADGFSDSEFIGSRPTQFLPGNEPVLRGAVILFHTKNSDTLSLPTPVVDTGDRRRYAQQITY